MPPPTTNAMCHVSRIFLILLINIIAPGRAVSRLQAFRLAEPARLDRARRGLSGAEGYILSLCTLSLPKGRRACPERSQRARSPMGHGSHGRLKNPLAIMPPSG